MPNDQNIKMRIKFKGSTMIETIIAMVIILICSGIALDHFSGLFQTVNDELRINAELKIQNLAVETKKHKEFSYLEIDSDGVNLVRYIEDYPIQSSLKLLRIEAHTLSGKKICEYRELINPF